MNRCVRSPTPAAPSTAHSVLALSPGDSIQCHRLRAQSHKAVPFPTSHANHSFRQSGCHLCCWLSIKGSHDSLPPVRFNSFARVGHRTQENSLCTRLPVIKGYSSETTRWKRCAGQGMGKRAELPELAALPEPSCAHQPRSSQNHCLP